MIPALLKLFSLCTDLIPDRVWGFVADSLGLFLYRVIGFRRKIVLENLTLAFGKEKSPKEISLMAKKNYQHNVRVLFEILRSVGWSREDFNRRTVFEGWDEMKKAIDENRTGFLLSSHLGNWEFAIATVTAKGLPVDVVVKKPRTKAGERFLKWYRTRLGGQVLYESGTARDILRAVTKNRFPVFVLDQFMGPPIGLPVEFFGHRAGTAVGLALLTEKRDIPLFTAYNYRDADGVVHTVLKQVNLPQFSEDKDTRLYQKTQFYNDLIESMIRKHPEQWLWLHRRWKPYRGEPRWKLPTLALGLTCLIAILSCSSGKTGTDTGIEIPADPKIAVPVFGKEEGASSVTGTQITKESTVPLNQVVPGVSEEVKKPVKKKSKKGAVDKTVPETTVVPVVKETPNSPPPFKIIPADKVPFDIGERMEVELTWMALPAGKAVLEVRPGPQFNDRNTFQLWGNVLSSKIVDTVYHVDNTIESYVDQEGLIPYKFLLSMFETHQKKETRVVFDHTQSKAFYWAKRISQKWGDQNIDRTDPFTPQSRDMFSALYYARAINYQLNRRESFKIYENGQNMDVELIPVANEVVRSGAGVFQCWKLKVEVKINNVFTPTGDLFLWLSDDSKKYVVKFDAKVKIGSLLGNLVSVREH